MSNNKSGNNNYQQEISNRLRYYLEHGEMVEDDEGEEYLRLPNYTRIPRQDYGSKERDLPNNQQTK